MKENEYLQFPPLHKDTDVRVIMTLWEYMRIPEDHQKVVLSTLKQMYTDKEAINYHSLPKENLMQFEEVMKTIISNITIEACELACWVYEHKIRKGWTLEEMIDAGQGAEQMVIAMDIIFDKLAE